MQQGHRIFVIAKPKGQQYRSLAAINNQWLYGISVLSRCRRLLHIFSDDANRIPIQQELAFAAEFFGNASEADVNTLAAQNGSLKVSSATPCPFPFITTCLIVGASYDPDLGECFPVDEAPFGMVYNHGPEDVTGITVLDITDLKKVRHCFAGLKVARPALHIPFHTPLDAVTYIKACFGDTVDTQELFDNNKATIDGLKKYSIVDLSALANCWPHGHWQTTAGSADPDVALAHAKSNKTSVPPLRSLSQGSLFQELLSRDGPPDLTLLDEVMFIPGFAHDLQRYLVDNADTLSKSPAAVEILKKAFAGETTFDFTPFHGKLSADDLVAFVSSEAMRNVKVANLSGFDSTTDLKIVAAALEHLKLESLYLLARPDRSTDNLFKMMETLEKCKNKPLVRQRLVLGSAYSQSIRRDLDRPQIPSAVDPSYWKTFPVIQLLYQGPDKFELCAKDLQRINFFLGDAFLTPVRFVTGLLNVIKGRFQEPKKAFMQKGETEFSLAFACAPSCLKTFMTSIEVGPPPAEAFARARRKHEAQSVRDEEEAPVGLEKLNIPARCLDPKGWTAVMVHNATMDPETLLPVHGKTRFRVALVRSKYRHFPIRKFKRKPCELEVVDLKGFLELTAPEHVGELDTVLSQLTAWAQTGEDLVSKLELNEIILFLKAFRLPDQD